MAPYTQQQKQYATALGIYLIMMRRRRRRNKSKARKIWCRSWVARREQHGTFYNLVNEMALEDDLSYRRYFRMDKNLFAQLTDLVAPYIARQDTNMRKCISPSQRFAITLRFLATGETFRSLQFAYRVGERTVSGIVRETCQVLYTCMKDIYMKTAEEWKVVARKFQEKWQYPLCLGALDGKHINIKKPDCSGSTFFNYKHFFSVVLLALTDADYRFLYVDVGACGRDGDAGIFNDSSLNEALKDGTLNIPPPETLPGQDQSIHYHIIGDDAFPLKNTIGKPYPYRNLNRGNQIYNYRFSRARRVVENSFGILANRFRIFLAPIALEPQFVTELVLAACCLHNFLIEHQSPHYQIPNLVDREDDMGHVINGAWRNDTELRNLSSTRERNPPISAKKQRELLMQYFLSPQGKVEWQDDHVV